MAHKKSVLELSNVEACCAYLGVEASDKLVSIIDLDEVGTVRYSPKRMGVYGLACSWQDDSDTGAYLHFYAPGYMDSLEEDFEYTTHGWAIVFDPKLLDDTLLANRMKEYKFFTPDTTNKIRLDSDERYMILCCFKSVRLELQNATDRFSAHIIAAGIAVLLILCMRYFEHQRGSLQDSADIIISKFSKLIRDYLSGSRDMLQELPTVSSCADVLHLSPNYLGDVVRKKLRCSAQQYIRQMVVKEAAHQLRYSSFSIGEIGYNLGFKYPHHFTRVFKQEFGVTPNEYRNQVLQNGIANKA